MERDAILAHGASSFLKETMMERSDKYKFYISSKTGLISIANPAKNIYEDFSHDNTEMILDVIPTIHIRIKRIRGCSQ